MPEGTVQDYTVRVRAGPSNEHLKTITVNDEFQPVLIESEHFAGYLVVRMLNFHGVTPEMEDKSADSEPIECPKSSYFTGKNRRYSIMLQGKFRKQWTGDDIIFGVEFDTPIRAPMGSSIGIRVAKWLDPAIEADIDCETPYIFSPLVSAMNSLAIYERSATELNQEPEARKLKVISDRPTPADAATLVAEMGEWAFESSMIPEKIGLLFEQDIPESPMAFEKRKKIFSNIEKRRLAQIKPDLIHCFDFYDAYFDFASCQIKLPGFTMNAFKYWDNQPLRFSAKTRDGGQVFFVVVFDLVMKSLYE